MQLYEWHWPVEPTRGAIALVHGAGEYCGRYDHVARRLNQRGYAVLGLDLPGHGKSPGRRGHIDDFATYVQSVDTALGRLEEIHPGLPRFLYGHSMGGLVAVRWLQTRPRQATQALRGVMLTSPCLDLSLPISPALLKAASVLDKVWPTFSQPSGIPPSAVSRHPDVVAAYATDPLVGHKVTARWAMELQRSMAAARSGPAAFDVPTLILQAGSDRLVSCKATRRFAERLGAPRKDYREFEGLYHELHNEPEREEILEIVGSFLDAALAAERTPT